MDDNRITLSQVKQYHDFKVMIDAANNALAAMGYTEHGLRHVGYVSSVCTYILRTLGYDERTLELAEIAGYLHDVGNLVNRHGHGISGACLVMPILINMGMPMEEATRIVSAIGNHEEQVGSVVSEISAALIIADKVDANRSRVRRGKYDPDDIHDRVNYAIKDNDITVFPQEKVIRYTVTMDSTSSAMEFFTIYMSRMNFACKAAAFLGCKLEIYINGMLLNVPK